jgi:hypothetical protein
MMEKANHEDLGDLATLHPYEYLTQLNSIYAEWNKSNVKCPSVSKVKLEWKPFTMIKIPNVTHFLMQCFEVTFKRFQRK